MEGKREGIVVGVEKEKELQEERNRRVVGGQRYRRNCRRIEIQKRSGSRPEV